MKGGRTRLVELLSGNSSRQHSVADGAAKPHRAWFEGPLVYLIFEPKNEPGSEEIDFCRVWVYMAGSLNKTSCHPLPPLISDPSVGSHTPNSAHDQIYLSFCCLLREIASRYRPPFSLMPCMRTNFSGLTFASDCMVLILDGPDT